MTNKRSKVKPKTIPLDPQIAEGYGGVSLHIEGMAAAGECLQANPTYYLIPKQGELTNLAEVRVKREGGITQGDKNFRYRLYGKIGEIAVAGAHVEASMKRVLVVLDGRYHGLYTVDSMWHGLHKSILKRCAVLADDHRVPKLIELLQWSEERGIRERRNTFIHGEWWLYKMDQLYLNKIHANKSTFVFTSWSALDETISDCWLLAKALDEMIADDWNVVGLPIDNEEELPLAFSRSQ